MCLECLAMMPLVSQVSEVPSGVLMYIDNLLVSLQHLGDGCLWKSLYAGAVCYVDDLALLAPALRLMFKTFPLLTV